MALVASQEARASTSDTTRSLAVHRLRFVDWSPSAVTALAVSPSNAVSRRGILAIGRQNGNIELCTWVGPRPALQSEFSDRSFQSDAAGWAVHTVLPGQTHSKIEQLCFANPPDQEDGGSHKLRLFSVSGGSIVTEHFIPLQLARLGARTVAGKGEDDATKVGNLSSLFGKKAEANLDPHYPGETRTLPSLGGAIWSMAASATGSYLAIGCEDGQVRILDLQDSKFEHLASSAGKQRMIVPRFDKTKGRIISLCWGPPIRAKAPIAKPESNDDDSTSDSDESDDDDDDDADASEWYESFLVGGLGVSAAVVWEASSGRIASKLALQKNRSESTIAWSVATLPDGTIVTGDSTGRVTFFDSQTRTPISGATFRAHATASDVLALTVGPDGRTVYSAGVDQKVAEFTKLDTSNQRGQWVQLASRRLHAHDIRAIALDPPYSPLACAQALADGRAGPSVDRLPILISGGVDFNLILTPAASPASITMALPASTLSQLPKAHSKHRRQLLTADEQKHAAINPISSNPLTTFADTTQRRVPFVPTTARAGLMGGGSVVALCPSKGWVVLRREQSIGIWDLGSKEALIEAASAPDEQPVAPAWYKLLEMQVKVDSNLISVAISDDGRYLAFSDLYETRLFELKQRKLASGLWEIEPAKVKSFGRSFGGQERMAPSASALRFSPDSMRMVLCSLTGAYVHVLELPSDSDSGGVCKLLRSFGHHRRQRVSTDDARQIAGRGSANGHTAENRHSTQDRVERTVSTVLHHAEISSDGAWLSTISSDLQHHIFSLDSLTFERTLPSPHALPSGAVFHPATSSQCSSLLTLVFSDNKVEFWDVDSGKELAKSTTSTEQDSGGDTATTTMRKTGANGATAHTLLVGTLTKLKHTLQTKLASVREFAVSAMWIPSETGGPDLISNYTMLVYGATWICTARIAKHPTAPTDNDDVDMTDVSNASSLLPSTADWSVHTTFKYQPLLLVAHLPTNSHHQQHLVIVERPYFELAASLPPAFYRGARYGT